MDVAVAFCALHNELTFIFQKAKISIYQAEQENHVWRECV